MSKLILFGRDFDLSEATIDVRTGKSTTRTLNGLGFLKEQVVLHAPMPEEYPLWSRKGKDGQELVRMKNLGLFVLCRVNERGQVVNVYGRRGDFNKPLPITAATVLELKRIFGGTA